MDRGDIDRNMTDNTTDELWDGYERRTPVQSSFWPSAFSYAAVGIMLILFMIGDFVLWRIVTTEYAAERASDKAFAAVFERLEEKMDRVEASCQK